MASAANVVTVATVAAAAAPVPDAGAADLAAKTAPEEGAAVKTTVKRVRKAATPTEGA